MNQEIEDLTFEEAFAELERIVSRLEDGGLTLEESLVVFERGRALAAYCSQQLDEAELKVKQMTPEGDIPFEIEE
ncbi:MAG: exodeoxyribonuclease VII small subunit [Anaerolineae bacterium]|jgi:exodeoxyribonuclease VII small subunit